jgi:acyl-CoA synthetase (AMP-forming)/AMP-acid ligase II
MGSLASASASPASPSPATDGTLIDVLLSRATSPGAGEEAYAFLGDGEAVTESLSWSGLAERALSVSAAVLDRAAPGDRALLLFWPGLDFLAAFLGCLHAGVLAVPCVPPRRPLGRSVERIAPIVQVSRPSVVLSAGSRTAIAEELRMLVPDLAACGLVDVSQLKATTTAPASRGCSRGRASGHDLAFLQFTSGSTSAPKAVMVTHANLVHNLREIHRGFEHDHRSVSVTWLPVYHDMGLIDGMLGPLFGGYRCVAMPPHVFLQRPHRWLRAISRYRGTHSGGPNFAYDLCVEKISPDEARALDLSSWRVAYNGAEPVRPTTLEAFARHFETAGFDRRALCPSYGLAEATLKVTCGSVASLHPRTVDAAQLQEGVVREVAGEPGPGVRAIASCGPVPVELDLLVVDPQSRRERRVGEIGEIWISGPSVAAGYFRAPAETKETFDARTEDGRGPFLRTGDLGFVRDEELYVVGRHKDLIILAGRNLYPQDVELSACGAHPALQGGSAAAFAVDDGLREHLVVLVEAGQSSPIEAPGLSDVVGAVRQAIARDHEVEPAVVGLVRMGALLRTSSGKIRRHACRRAFSAGEMLLLARCDAGEPLMS